MSATVIRWKTALRAGTEALGDRLHIVIANAGIAPMAGDDAWQDVIDVNLTRRLQHRRRGDDNRWSSSATADRSC